MAEIQRDRRAERREKRKRTTEQRKRKPKTPIPAVYPSPCLNRGSQPLGKLKCSCSTAPLVFTCSNPNILSGFATPETPSRSGDGHILYSNGTKSDESYLPYPLREGEVPRKREVICCDSCPFRDEPPPELIELQKLGVYGPVEAEILHVVDQSHAYLGKVLADGSPIQAAYSPYNEREHLKAVLGLLQPKVVAVHGFCLSLDDLVGMAFEHEGIAFANVYHGDQSRILETPRAAVRQQSAIQVAKEHPRIWYCVSQNHAIVSQHVKWWPMCVGPGPSEPKSCNDPPTLLLKDDPAAIWSAAESSIPFRILALAPEDVQDILAVGEAAGVEMEIVSAVQSLSSLLRERVSFVTRTVHIDHTPIVRLLAQQQGVPSIAGTDDNAVTDYNQLSLATLDSFQTTEAMWNDSLLSLFSEMTE